MIHPLPGRCTAWCPVWPVWSVWQRRPPLAVQSRQTALVRSGLYSTNRGVAGSGDFECRSASRGIGCSPRQSCPPPREARIARKVQVGWDRKGGLDVSGDGSFNVDALALTGQRFMTDRSLVVTGVRRFCGSRRRLPLRLGIGRDLRRARVWGGRRVDLRREALAYCSAPKCGA